MYYMHKYRKEDISFWMVNNRDSRNLRWCLEDNLFTVANKTVDESHLTNEIYDYNLRYEICDCHQYACTGL
jgi:hypothetical protein